MMYLIRLLLLLTIVLPLSLFMYRLASPVLLWGLIVFPNLLSAAECVAGLIGKKYRLLHFGVLAGYMLAILVMIAGFIVACNTHDSGGSEAEAAMNTAYAVLLVLIPAVLNGGGLALAVNWSRWIKWT